MNNNYFFRQCAGESIFYRDDEDDEIILMHSLLRRGSTPEQQMRGWSDDGFLYFPGHASWGNWNSDPDGWTDYPPDPEVLPLGGGALLLIGFGAAYAMKKRNKED